MKIPKTLLTLVVLGAVTFPPISVADVSKCDELTTFTPGTLKGFASNSPREKAFDAMYNAPFKLPVDEGVFVEFLKKNKLDFEVRASGEEAGCVDFPLVNRLIDTNIRKTYRITDMSQLKPGRAVYFEAFVDRMGQVTYVEN